MKKKKDKHEALDAQLAALFGDPSTADASEVEGVCEEVNGSADLVQLAYDLAVRAAQQYRLAGKPVPPHVEAAMAQMKKSSTLEGASPTKLGEIVDSVMKPFRGPADVYKRQERCSCGSPASGSLASLWAGVRHEEKKGQARGARCPARRFVR